MLTHTSQHYDWKMSGKLDPCEDCAKSKARQANVNQETAHRSEVPRERFYLDLSKTHAKSYGGAENWCLLVDDCTDKSWSSFHKYKSDMPEQVMTFLKHLKAKGIPVKEIRLDNAGEIYSLEELCKQEGLGIEFKFTPRDSPQFNGRVERKFTTLYSRV